MASVTLAGDTLAGDTLASDTLARVTLRPVFLLPLGGPKGEKRFQRFKKKIQIFPYGPSYGIFIHPLVPQRKQEKLGKVSLWPRCHWLYSLWPKFFSGQSVILAKFS